MVKTFRVDRDFEPMKYYPDEYFTDVICNVIIPHAGSKRRKVGNE